ncbi:MAG: hypothetical protein WC175_01010 [Candidatus Dojkabacteria bacterium]
MPYNIYIHTTESQPYSPYEVFRNVFFTPDLAVDLNNEKYDIPVLQTLNSIAALAGEYNAIGPQDLFFTHKCWRNGDLIPDYLSLSPGQGIQMGNPSNQDNSIKLESRPQNVYHREGPFVGTWTIDSNYDRFISKHKYRLSLTSFYEGPDEFKESGYLYLHLNVINGRPRCQIACTKPDPKNPTSEIPVGPSINFSQVGQKFKVTVRSITDDEKGPNYFAKKIGSLSSDYVDTETGIGLDTFFRVSSSTARYDAPKEMSFPELAINGFSHTVRLVDSGDNDIEDPMASLANIDRVVIEYTLTDINDATISVNNKSLILRLFDDLITYEEDPHDDHQLYSEFTLVNTATVNGNIAHVEIVPTNEEGYIVNDVKYYQEDMMNDFLEHTTPEKDSYINIITVIELPNKDDLYFGILQLDPGDPTGATTKGVMCDNVQVIVDGFGETSDNAFINVVEETSQMNTPPSDNISPAFKEFPGGSERLVVFKIKRKAFWNGFFNLKLFCYSGFGGGNGLLSVMLVQNENNGAYIKSIRNAPILMSSYGTD